MLFNSKHILHRCIFGIIFIALLLDNLNTMPYTYQENLPKDCPPSTATAPNGEQFYRFVNANPATSEDFLPNTHRVPKSALGVTAECIGCAVSLFRIDNGPDMAKLPAFKNKIRAVVTLTDKDGLVLQTFTKPHHSWWRSVDFRVGNNISY